MSVIRNITILAVVVVLGVGLFLIWPDSYSRFRHRSEPYYAEFSQACDSLLAQHPLGTNRFIEVSVTDATLPKMIRDLSPSKIKISANRVWILSQGDQFGIAWEPQGEVQTNVWALRTDIESDVRTIYTAKR